jgi:hypothetical protein
MRPRTLLAAALTSLTILTFTAGVANAAPLLDRPAAELFGTHAIYGTAGAGVNSATGNYSLSGVDLDFPSGLLHWGRTYNSKAGRSAGAGPST